MLVPVMFALGVVLTRPDRLRALLRIRLRGLYLIWLAAAVQFVRISDPHLAAWFTHSLDGRLALAMIWVLGVAFVVANLRHRPATVQLGLVVLAVGFSLNSLVIALNGGMPFSPPAARASGIPEEVVAEETARYKAFSPDTVLGVLGDVIPVPGLQKVVSVGDVLMFLGISWLIVALAWSGSVAGQARTAASGPGLDRPTSRLPTRG